MAADGILRHASERAGDKFHARHDAVSRVYLYQISTRRTAFAKPFVWWIKDRLDVDAMGYLEIHDETLSKVDGIFIDYPLYARAKEKLRLYHALRDEAGAPA